MDAMHRFAVFARRTAHASGHPYAFLLAILVVIVWGLTGPACHFSDTWQLVINTGTTIVTFLMVFLIQNAQNRDTAAMQVKLDELIRAVTGAHNVLIELEDLDDAELERVRSNYRRLAQLARQEIGRGAPDTTTPNIDVACIRPGTNGGEPDGGHAPGPAKRRRRRRKAA